MKTSILIITILLMFMILMLHLALIAAGCWMIYNGWYGCGLTTIILNMFVGGKFSAGKDDESEEKDK